MVTLTDEIKESFAAAKLAFFATSAKDRMPNVVPGTEPGKKIL